VVETILRVGEDTAMATVVFVHAHPDDEALLTAGTMRALREKGHRVVVIMATNGDAGLSDIGNYADLGNIRKRELQDSARILGVSETYFLNYRDSGLDGNISAVESTLCQASVEEIANSIAAILINEKAQMVIGYDSKGGYGHPDHIQIHKATIAAGKMANTPVVANATVDRQTIAILLDYIRPLLKIGPLKELSALADGFTPRADITHRVDVSNWTGFKRASMRAHGSQRVGGSTIRTLQVFSNLPSKIFNRAFKYEWYQVVTEEGQNPLNDLPLR
jgi:LmbE family N-acetylglucosaminyl deacetylase